MTERSTYPKIGESHWWTLRNRFKNSPPRTKITADYLVSVFESVGVKMSPESARNNVRAPLILIGMIDKDGEPNTELIDKWRANDEYADALEEFRSRVYPRELLELHPNPSENLEAVTNWFSRNASVGAAAAKRMAGTYELLSDPDPSRGDTKKPRPSSAGQRKTSAKRAAQDPSNDGIDNHVQAASAQLSGPGIMQKSKPVSGLPTVHVDLQIHISSETTDSQIESIFRNIAKYLYQRDSNE